MREGDRELVGGGGEGEVVPLLQLALVVVLLQGDHLVAAQAGQSAAQQRVRVLLVNLNTQGNMFIKDGFKWPILSIKESQKLLP